MLSSLPLRRELIVHHVANRLGVPRRTVRYWAKTGRIAGRKDGPKIWKFTLEAVEAFQRELIEASGYNGEAV